MKHSVKEHLDRINGWIGQLEAELANSADELSRMNTASELRSLRLAAMHYELALEIEDEVANGRRSRSAEPLRPSRTDDLS